jgi:C-terminal processing protease CtpA/Prc
VIHFGYYSMLIYKKTAWLVATVAALSFSVYSPAQQKINKVDQDRARGVLHLVKDTIEKNYYDPTFHGYDLDARFQAANQKLADIASFEMGMNVVGWAVQGLNDSHTMFIPPLRNVLVYSGWRIEMVGGACMISAVEPKSDAWKQGLRPGDVVEKVDDYQPTRSNFGQIRYIFSVLAPLAQYHFLVASPSQPARSVTTRSRLVNIPLTNMPGATTTQQLQRSAQGDWVVYKTRAVEVNDKLMIWKIPIFWLPESEVKREVSAARKHETLILDLRDNGGGRHDDLRWLIGTFFDHDVTVGEMIERDKTEPLKATSIGKGAFTGKLIVLVNSESASAAEIFARTVQLEKRGIVIGDRTAGAVRVAKIIPLGLAARIPWGMEMSIARLIMSDGADLEGKGVTPDTLMLPTSTDLAEGRDPVLSTAAQLAGVQLSPEEAAKMFPIVWPTY